MEDSVIARKVSPHILCRAYPDIENFKRNAQSYACRRRWHRRRVPKHKEDVLQIGRDIVQNDLDVEALAKAPIITEAHARVSLDKEDLDAEDLTAVTLAEEERRTLLLMAAVVAIDVVYQEGSSVKERQVALLRKYELLMILKDKKFVKTRFAEGYVLFRMHIFCVRVPLQVARREGLISQDIS